MFDKKLKNISDAVMSVIGVQEEIDPNKRTKDTTKGQEPTKQKDDVGPGSDGKSTKVKYRPGPLTTSEGFKDRLLNRIEESSEEMLSRYMKSRGYNPVTATKDQKIALSKSNEFKKWINDHQVEEVGYEDYSDEELTEMINEVLSKDASVGDWIHDFVHSDNPKFKGKSKEQRKKQALAAYYAHQREEWEAEPETKEPEAKDDAKLKSQAQNTKKTLDKISKAFAKKNESVDLEEGKRPEGDSVPWVGDAGKDTPEVVTDKSGGKHTPMSRAKHLARMSLKKVKSEVVEEVEQIDEISAQLAARYINKKHERDYEKTGEFSFSRKKPITTDAAYKDVKNSKRALNIILKNQKKKDK